MTDEDDTSYAGTGSTWRTRLRRGAETIGRQADGTEARFLSLLRHSVLLIAALLLVFAAGFLAYGLWQQIGRDSVDSQKVTISNDDVAPPLSEATSAAIPVANSKRQLPVEVRKRTLSIYRSKFQPFERGGTARRVEDLLTLIWPETRLRAFDALQVGGLVDSAGKPFPDSTQLMLDGLFKVEQASRGPAFQAQLIAYRNAKQVRVCTDKVRMRSREVSGWDTFSTACDNWYVSPIGCASTRTIQEPTLENVCEMKFPDDLSSPSRSFADGVQRYLDVAGVKLSQSRIAADEERLRIRARKLEGRDNMLSSGKLFFGFLAVMLLYLLIALERHHRSLRVLIANRGAPTGIDALV